MASTCKKSKVKLNLLTDIDMSLMPQNGTGIGKSICES